MSRIKLAKPKIQPGPWRRTVEYLPADDLCVYIQEVTVQFGNPQGPTFYDYRHWNSLDYFVSDVADDTSEDARLIHNLGQHAYVLQHRDEADDALVSNQHDVGEDPEDVAYAAGGKHWRRSKSERTRYMASKQRIQNVEPDRWIDSGGTYGRDMTVMSRCAPPNALLKLPAVSKYNRAECIVKINGVDTLGQTVLVRLTEWMPWITIDFPVNAEAEDIARAAVQQSDGTRSDMDVWADALCQTRPWDEIIREWLEDEEQTRSDAARSFFGRIHWSYFMAQDWYGFIPNPLDPLQPARHLAARLYAPNRSTLTKLCQFVRLRGGRVHEFDYSSARVQPVQQVHHQTNIKDHAWMRVSQWREPDQFYSHTQIEVETSWQNVAYIPDRSDIPPLTRLSFDIECYDPKNEFPDATREGCSVTTIGCTLSRFGAAGIVDPEFTLLEQSDVAWDAYADRGMWFTDSDPQQTRIDSELGGSILHQFLGLHDAQLSPEPDSYPSDRQLSPEALQLGEMTCAHHFCNLFFPLHPADQWWFQTHGHSLADKYRDVTPRCLRIIEWAHSSHAYHPMRTGSSTANVTKSRQVDAVRTRRLTFEYCPDLPEGLDFLRLRIPSPYAEDGAGIFVVCCRTESLMMRSFARWVRAVQPDMIVGHNTTFDYGYLFSRAALIFGEPLPVQLMKMGVSPGADDPKAKEAEVMQNQADEHLHTTARRVHRADGAAEADDGDSDNSDDDNVDRPDAEDQMEYNDGVQDRLDPQLENENNFIQRLVQQVSRTSITPMLASPHQPVTTTRSFADRDNMGYTSSDFFWLGRMLFDTTPTVVERDNTGANGAREAIYPPLPAVMDFDTYKLIMADTTMKYANYKLSYLSQILLKDDKIDLPPEAINARFRGSGLTAHQGLVEYLASVIAPSDPHWHQLSQMLQDTSTPNTNSQQWRESTISRLLEEMATFREIGEFDASSPFSDIMFSWPWNTLRWDATRNVVIARSAYYDITAYCMHDTDCCTGLLVNKKMAEQAVCVGFLTNSPACTHLKRGVQYRIFNMIATVNFERNIVMQRPIDLEHLPLEGACVINPVSGLYDDAPVNTEDYAAMYPSNIQDKNLCFTTIFRPVPLERSELVHNSGKVVTRYLTPSEEELVGIYGIPEYPSTCNTPTLRRYHDLLKPKSSARTLCFRTSADAAPVHVIQYDETSRTGYRGVLPAIIDSLKAERDKAKNEMKRIMSNPLWWDHPNQKWLSDAAKIEYEAADSKQIAIKVTANSVYGFNGASTGAIACVYVARIITHCARLQLEFTKDAYECRYNHVKPHEENMRRSLELIEETETVPPVIHRGACCYDSDFTYHSQDRTSPPPYRFLFCALCLTDPVHSNHSSQESRPTWWMQYESMVNDALPLDRHLAGDDGDHPLLGYETGPLSNIDAQATKKRKWPTSVSFVTTASKPLSNDQGETNRSAPFAWDCLKYPLAETTPFDESYDFHRTGRCPISGITYWDLHERSRQLAGRDGSNDAVRALARPLNSRFTSVHHLIETLQCARQVKIRGKLIKPKKNKAVFEKIGGQWWDEQRSWRYFWPKGAPPPARRPLFRNPSLKMQIIYGDTDSVMMAHYWLDVDWTLNTDKQWIGTMDTISAAIEVGKADSTWMNNNFVKLGMFPAIKLEFEKLYLPYWIGMEKKMYIGVKYEEKAKFKCVEQKTIGKKRDTYALVARMLDRVIKMIMLLRQKSDVMRYVHDTLTELIEMHSNVSDMSLFIRTKALRQHSYSEPPEAGAVETATPPTTLSNSRSAFALIAANSAAAHLQSKQTRISNAGRTVPVHDKNRIFLPVATKSKAQKSPAIPDHASANMRYEAAFPGASYATGARIPYFISFDPSGYRKWFDAQHRGPLMALAGTGRTTMAHAPKSTTKTSELAIVLDHWEKIIAQATEPAPSPDMAYYINACSCLLSKLLVSVPGFTADYFDRMAARALLLQYAPYDRQAKLGPAFRMPSLSTTE